MPASQVAEALYLAHKFKATGALNLKANGRQSQLLLQQGDIVGAKMASGGATIEVAAKGVMRDVVVGRLTAPTPIPANLTVESPGR